jgi:hypothetical protein
MKGIPGITNEYNKNHVILYLKGLTNEQIVL